MSNNTSLAAAGFSGYMFRNHIINGDFRIDQRNEGIVTNPTNGTFYTVDRWLLNSTVSNKISVQRLANFNYSVLPFTNYISLTVNGAAQTTLAATDQVFFGQRLEPSNVSDFLIGTVQAKPVTLSFWAMSTNVTGNFSVNYGTDNAGTTIGSFAINTTNVWQYYTITIPPVTNTSLVGSSTVRFILAAGANQTIAVPSTSTTVNSTVFSAFTNQTNLLATLAGNLCIAGVQLEKGSIPTPFEYCPFEIELSRCQRFYEKSYEVGTQQIGGIIPGTVNASGNTTMLFGTSLAANYLTLGFSIFFKVNKYFIPTITSYSQVNGIKNKTTDFASSGSPDVPLNLGSVGTKSFVGYATTNTQVQTANFQFHWTAEAEI